MSSKCFIIFFIQAFVAQVALTQCIHPYGEYVYAVAAPSIGSLPCGVLGANGLAYGGGIGFGIDGFGIGIANGYIGTGLNSIEATHSGAFPVQSASITAPSGISVASENTFGGSLNVIGELPFLSVVALEGVTPSGGAGVVHHSCGNGVTAITSENSNGASVIGIGSAGIGAGYGSGIGAGYRSGIGALPSDVGVNLESAEGHTCGCGLY